MGAVHFSIDPRLLELFKSKLNIQTFVETGTFHGDSIASALPYFPTIYSVELSKTLADEAKERFKDYPQVHIDCSSSDTWLLQIQPQVAQYPTLYWLDAHWCAASDTAGVTSQCPLINEISAITTLSPQSIVVIDDARLFLTTPPKPHEVSQWPQFHDILTALQELSSQHRIMVLNDCIIYYPSLLQQALSLFAYEHGVDWNVIYNNRREVTTLESELIAKEKVIQNLLRLNGPISKKRKALNKICRLLKF